MKYTIRKILVFVIGVFIFTNPATVRGETTGNALLTGAFDNPVTVTAASPVLRQLSQFGPERLESLNDLLKHISFSVKTKEEISETTLSFDDEPLYSFVDRIQDNELFRIYSFDPETVYISGYNESENESGGFSSFVEERFFPVNNLLNDLIHVFSRMPEAFPELAKKSSAMLNFSGFGKAVNRIIIQFSPEYVSEKFPDAVSNLCESDTGKSFTGNLLYRGVQKIVLLYDQNDQLVRINYDGVMGSSEDSLRKVSLVWKCLRTENHIKDSMTLKTPAISGYDRDNVIYDRDLDLSQPEKQVLKWNYQLDEKKDKEKRKISYTGDLSADGPSVTGKITYNVKGSNPDQTIVFSPQMEKEKESDYRGTLEITYKTGKIITSSISFGLCIKQEEDYDFAYTGNKLDWQKGKEVIRTEADSIPDETVRLLIKKMMLLSREETEFLTKDIPDDIIHSMINH